MHPILVFDADDTLWDEQSVLQKFEFDLETLLNRLTGRGCGFQQRFVAVESENIPSLGYGLVSYAFSVAETIAAVPDWHRHKAAVLALVADLIGAVQSSEPRVIEGVHATLANLSRRNYRLVLLTRGIDFEQRSKLERSGLSGFFSAIKVVGRKDAQLYRDTASALGDPSGRALCMIGNSMRSDVVPALEAGWRAIHVPAPTEWAHDAADAVHCDRFRRAGGFSQVAELVQSAEFWG